MTYATVFTKPRIAFVAVATLVGGAVAVAVAVLSPTTFDTSISFSVNRINRQETKEYQFDEYYALQASNLFAETVVSWFATPSIVQEIYERAAVDPRIRSIDELASRLKTRKPSSQNIVVRFREEQREDAAALVAALTDIAEERTAALNQSADRKALFELVTAKPVIVERRPNVLLAAAAGLLAGLFISSLLVSLAAYLKPSTQLPGRP